MNWEEIRKVLPSTASVNARGHLELGGCDMVDVAREHGTPLFVLDVGHLRDRLRRYASCFGGPNVHYAAKAFLTRSLVPILAEEGVGLDCASGGELYVALAGGFPAERIVLHGNNKTPEELERAVDAGVGRIVLDSLWELDDLERIAAARGVTVQTMLRVTPGVEAHTHEYLKTGIEDTKFGLPIGGPAMEAIRAAAKAEHVELIGLHSHIGSQVFDLEPFGEAARVMVRFLAEARADTGLDLPELDLGGGLGIAYEPSDEPRSVEELAGLLKEVVADESHRLGTPEPVIKVEPGRSVVGPAMITLYTSGVVKEIPGVRRYVSVDGGMSDNIRPSLYQAAYTFLSARRPQAPHETAYAIAGKLCETGDVLRRDALLPELEPGELIATAVTGAYGYAMASNYNLTPRPAVVAVEDGTSAVLARRETFEDLIRLSP